MVMDEQRLCHFRDYYVDDHGVKVLYAADEAAPTYLAELRADYEAIQRGEVELVSSEDVVQELRGGRSAAGGGGA